MEIVESINLITRKPGVRGGRPCIKGTGLRVIRHRRRHGGTLSRAQTPEQIAVRAFRSSLWQQVYAALDLLQLCNKDEIDADIRSGRSRKSQKTKG